MGNINKLHDMLVGKQLSSRELAQMYIGAIQSENGRLNAFSHTTPETALAAADAADKRIASGGDIPLLCGIPMALKANISTCGIVTDCCSKMLDGYRPIFDATVWQKLTAEGAVLLGKTNMDEFAMGSSTENSCHGTTSNPFDFNKVAGGSSGGSAAAVSANLAVYSLGSDTGGSVRQPASFCGVFGLKPTYGAVSRYGLIAYASSLEQIGVIAGDSEDCAVVFDAISGRDPRDSRSVDVFAAPSRRLDSAKGVKIGIPREFYDSLCPDVAKALSNAAAVYRSLGAQLVQVSLPTLKYALPVYYILACAEASSNLGRYDGIRFGYRAQGGENAHEIARRTRTEGFGAEVRRRILLGTFVLSSGYYDEYYKKANLLRKSITADFENCLKQCDILLAPTAPTAAFRRGIAVSDPVKTYQSDICTVSANIAGLPAAAVPCGFDADGMPIGMQLIGRAFCEHTLLDAAHIFETATERIYIKNSRLGVQL
ncbi:MAG: Asp-tRNA(Asn)/Glu-tRNA(Gln) amidotransferase subunit GatA [Firmicutes bacterium]|nr:Asp-tRNA(Asn)/Glu-tRNA(Gln) amidotransferase subunit GatA [Bacillota bacterium]